LGQTPAAAPGAPQLGALSPATALGEIPQLPSNVPPGSMYSPSPGMWRGAPPSPAPDNPQPIFPATPVPAAPVTRLQQIGNVSALSGSVPSIPPQQKTVYPTPPYYSGPGDEQFLRTQPLPPDRNTYQPQDIMQNSLRIRQEDIWWLRRRRSILAAALIDTATPEKTCGRHMTVVRGSLMISGGDPRSR
jgi:hypothetical protein